ncbi:MAG: flagellar basal body-associated protein FliL [Nocardioides sp.]|nr:flagellar basal body-associated protein FliL [Nocardioides sp.]
MSATLTPPATTEAEAPKKGGLVKKLLLLVVVLAVVAGAAWWFVLRPVPETAPEPGEVMVLEPVQVNLQGGHYLRLGMALQMTSTVAHELDGSKALDAAIDLFSGLPQEELATKKQRADLKAELEEELDHRYHGEVMGVYYTEFVTQ